MSDENKTPAELEAEALAQKAEEAKVEKDKQDAEFEDSLDGLSDEEKEAKRTERDASHPDNQTDYKDLLEKEKLKTKKAEDALAKKRIQDKKPKDKDIEADIDDIDDDDKPMTRREFREETSKNQKETQKFEAEKIATGLSGSEDERDLILEIFNNRTFPDHMSLQEQIDEAHLIANKDKTKGVISELKRKVKGEGGVGDNSAGTHQIPTKSNSAEPKQETGTKSVLEKGGFKWNPITKRHEKTTSNGTVLARDPDTGKLTPVK